MNIYTHTHIYIYICTYISMRVRICMYSQTSLTDHIHRFYHSPISITLLGSQTIAHAMPLWQYSNPPKMIPSLNRPFPSVPWSVDLERFCCIYIFLCQPTLLGHNKQVFFLHSPKKSSILDQTRWPNRWSTGPVCGRSWIRTHGRIKPMTY